MSETVFYLKWDGSCPSKLDAPKDWCNHRGPSSATKPPESPPSKGTVTSSGKKEKGATLKAQRAEITLVGVSQMFAPVEEHALIKVKVKNIQKAGCIVLQIRDVNGTLVYAERLTQRKIWGLATD